MRATTGFLRIFPLLLGLTGCAGADSSSELQRQIDEVEVQISAEEYVAAAATASEGLDVFPDSQTLRTLQVRADCGILRNRLSFINYWNPVSLDPTLDWKRPGELSGADRRLLKDEIAAVFPPVVESFVPIDERGDWVLGEAEDGYNPASLGLALLEYATDETNLTISLTQRELITIENYFRDADELLDSVVYSATGVNDDSYSDEFPALCQADDILLDEGSLEHDVFTTSQTWKRGFSAVRTLAAVYSDIRECEELGSTFNGFRCSD